MMAIDLLPALKQALPATFLHGILDEVHLDGHGVASK
jgi:hypothetical protein